jgi:tRNA-modifying protein YgfZ
MAGDEMLQRLTKGTAFADLSERWKLEVTGSDARRWLNDLVSADIGDLEPGQAGRSLLLSPTGRIRAAFTVACLPDGFLLVQDPVQPRPIGTLLQPYTLSSDVRLVDRTEALALFSCPGQDPGWQGGSATMHWRPSCLGGGIDIAVPAGEHAATIDAFEHDAMRQATSDDLEAWRILAGLPRFGVDAIEEDLPQEGGLEEAVALDKGCYLGQEAVAKVRNLGHPRRLLVWFESPEEVPAGDRILVRGREVGHVTSATRIGHGSVLFGRVAWDAREGPFGTALGAELAPGSRSPARPLPAP